MSIYALNIAAFMPISSPRAIYRSNGGSSAGCRGALASAAGSAIPRPGGNILFRRAICLPAQT